MRGWYAISDTRPRLTTQPAKVEARHGDYTARQDDGLTISFFSPDRERGERALTERYGAMIITEWLGPASIAEEPCPFGSWIADGRKLTVFYALPHNGERPGRCTASEHPGPSDRHTHDPRAARRQNADWRLRAIGCGRATCGAGR